MAKVPIFKVLLLFFLFIMFFSTSSGQVDKKYLKSRDNARPKNIPIVPNGVWLHDNVFIDQTEIANIHWREFIAYMSRDSSLLDSVENMSFVEEISTKINIHKILTYEYSTIDSSESIVPEHYLLYPGYRFFPVVGITHKQALAYCRWRSAAVNQVFQFADGGDSLGVYFNFRLPTEQEWEMAAYGSRMGTNYGLIRDSIEIDSKVIRKTKKVVSYNIKKNFRPNFVSKYQFQNIGRKPLYAENINMLSYIYGNMENSLRLYNMIGNVAEMIDRDSIAKGGSWRHEAEECKISNRQYYDCPTEWLVSAVFAMCMFIRKKNLQI